MSEPLRLQGISASAGYAEGPLFDLDQTVVSYVGKETADDEKAALEAAIAVATSRLTALSEMAEGDAADILEFQIAMLQDDALSSPAFAAIRTGLPADKAWRQALDTEIAGYDASDQDYFRARAADIRDIRDQVLRALSEDGDVQAPTGAILYGWDIAPTRFLETDWSRGGGIALKAGSTASHVAMLARSRGVPMVVGLGTSLARLTGTALLDAEHGGIVLSPSKTEIAAFRQSSSSFRRAATGPGRSGATGGDQGRHGGARAGQHRRPVRCRPHRHYDLRRSRVDAHRIPVRQDAAG